MPDPSSASAGESPDVRCAFYTLGDGARMRYAVLEPADAPRGTFLVAPGRREFIEKKHLEAGLDLLARGFRVILFDWRGHGLSSRLLTGARRQRDHIGHFDVYADDLRAFYRDIVAPRRNGPLYILAHSMGALIATLWLAENDAPEVKGVIMTAPALALGLPPASRAISRACVRCGLGEQYAAGQHDYGARDRKFKGNRLSHDPARFAVIETYFAANPDLAVGGVTWGWLAAMLDVTERLRGAGYLERLCLPVLALFGGRDIVTPPVKTLPLIRRMPNAEAVLIAGARHDLINEADVYRDHAWRHIDLFLRRLSPG